MYNSSCPAVLVDWCKPNKIKAVTCKDVSIGNYIDAHETVMKIKYKQIINLHSNNTYILREAPRYSGKFLNIISRFISLTYFVIYYIVCFSGLRGYTGFRFAAISKPPRFKQCWTIPDRYI